MRERADVLEETVKGILQLSHDSAARVWNQVQDANPEAENDDYDRTGEGRRSGADGVFWDSQQDSSRLFKDPPAIKGWKPLEG